MRLQIDLIADTSRELLEPPELIEQILAKANDGCPVRILVCEPDQSLLRLLDTSGIEIRFSEIRERAVTHRADVDTLAWIPSPPTRTTSSPCCCTSAATRRPAYSPA